MSLCKVKGRATTFGQEFEFMLAALLFVRLKQRPDLRFELATNVAGADPCDDILLRLNWSDESNAPHRITYLVQLKHGETPNEFKGNPFSGRKGKYSACTYFKGYKNLALNINEIRGENTDNMKYLSLHGTDEYRFIVYTNNTFRYILEKTRLELPLEHLPKTSDTNDSLPNPETRQYLEEYFPHCDLLTTAEGNGGYIFSEKDGSVWNLLNGNVLEEEYRDVFLKHFRIFSGQPSSTAFENIIAKELKTLFQLSDAQNQRILQEYLRRCKDWWESGKGDIWTNETAVLEEILIEDINCKFQDALSEHCFSNFRFSDESREDLAQRIRCHRISVVSTPGVNSLVKCSKLLQVFDSTFGNNVLLLDTKTLRSINYAVKALLRSNSLGGNSVILVSVPDEERKILETVQEICQDAQGNVVIACSSPEQIASILTEKIGRIEDKWSMDQLDLDGQSNLLEEKVNFQGRHVILRELETKWPTLRQDVDGPFLCALAEGSAILGESLMPLSRSGESDALYLPRVIEHRSELKREVLFLNTGRDRFVLSGFSRSLLLELQAERQYRKINDDLWHVSSSYEANIENPERDHTFFLNICKRFPEDNVHHVAFSENNFVWIDSRGSHDSVIPFIILRSSICNKGPQFCQHREDATDFWHWNERTFYLSGGPGIGKSTFLSHLSKTGSEVYWHIFIPLARFTWLWKHLCENDRIVELHHIIQLFAEAVKAESCSSPHTTKTFLQSSFMIKGNMRLFVDGVEEICPRYKTKACDLIKLLTESKAKQVWVSSRNHLEQELRKFFKHGPLHLRPFSEEEQIDYICRFSSPAACGGDAEELRRSVENVVKYMKISTTREGRFISDVPLHTHFLARAYMQQPDLLNEAIRGTIVPLVKLYQIFISENIRIYMEKLKINPDSPNFESIRRKIFKMHEECALSILGLDDFLRKDCIQNHAYDNKDDNTGILYFSDTGPVFVHYSFVEYFFTSWVIGNIEQTTEAIWERCSDLSHFFINALLASGCKLHEAIIGGNIEQIRSHLEFIQELDKGGRTALHLASINGNVEACCLLVQAGTNINAKDNIHNWSALQYADDAGHLAVVNVLLEAGGKLQDAKKTIRRNITTKGSVFRLAAEKGYLNIMKLIVDMNNDFMLSKENMRYFTNDGAADHENRTPLHISTVFDKKEIVELLLDIGASVNAADKKGKTSLHYACEFGYQSVMELLLSKGALVNAVTNEGKSPLHSSCRCGHKAIVELLLDEGASVNDVDNEGESALHYACRLGYKGIVEQLLNKGADFVSGNKEKKTPLHYACEFGHEDAVKLLLDKGASVDVANSEERTPLHYACEFGHQGTVKLLLDKGASVNAVNKNRESALHYACVSGYQNVVELLLNKDAFPGAANKEEETPLHYAAKLGYHRIVELLLDKGASVDAVNDKGISALLYACMYRHQAIVELLLDRDASPDAVDKDGKSPLYYAYSYGDEDIVKLLLNIGASDNVINKNGKNSLYYADMGQQGVGQLLPVKGALNSAVNSSVHTACALGKKDDVERHLNNGTSPDAVNENGDSLLHCAIMYKYEDIVKLLLDKAASVNVFNKMGISPLQYACTYRLQDTMELLLNKGAYVNAVDKEELSALHYASTCGSLDIVKLLLENGASVNTVDKRKESPLHYACKRGYRYIVELLLEKGALVNIVNEDQKSPLDHALQIQHRDIVKLLRDKGAVLSVVDNEANLLL